MIEDQRPHTGLKGAKVTDDIQELMSFSDANKTIGGYIEDEPTTGIIHLKREKLPRFSSTVHATLETERDAGFEREEETEDDDDVEVKSYEGNGKGNGEGNGGENEDRGQIKEINSKGEKSENRENDDEDDEEDDDDEDDDDDDDTFFRGNYRPASDSFHNNRSHRPVVIDAERDKGSVSESRKSTSEQATTQAGEKNEIVIYSSDSDQVDNESNNVSRSTKRATKRSRRNSNSLVDELPRKMRTRNTRSPVGLQFQAKQGASVTETPTETEDDEDEQFFKDLAREAGRSASTLERNSPATENRVFNIKFTSNLEGTIEKKINAKVKGTHTFSQILPMALNLIIKEYNVPKELRPQYESQNVSIYRNGVKILNFMSCNSLQVSADSNVKTVEASLSLVPKALERDYEAKYEKAGQGEVSSILDDIPIDCNETSFLTGDENEDDNAIQLSDGEAIQVLDDSSLAESNAGIIKIALMAKNNVKTHVNVHRDTSFAKLDRHFRMVNNIPAGVDLRFVFDNENISPTQVIEDLDLEDEDIIEVRLV
ncbi:LAME_0D02740g1_1 [Lachancea meyersii CBS 8951]|uniref:LAME_0D02740g1_1 n=1 Tax=Lachancea meyersii CBS 8951 TaxID=1266667 RepID=A0A1G4J7I3_9SACH|nr:LAME_0D02740g1_1 [Lachancea meyersii CBS 8951]